MHMQHCYISHNHPYKSSRKLIYCFCSFKTTVVNFLTQYVAPSNPSLHLWFLEEIFVKNSCLCIVIWCRQRTCIWCVNLRLMCHASYYILACAPTNGIQQPVHSSLSVFPAKTLQEWGCSYAQNETQKAHSQRISCLLVASLNATLIVL